jgi:hypothetical protein
MSSTSVESDKEIKNPREVEHIFVKMVFKDGRVPESVKQKLENVKDKDWNVRWFFSGGSVYYNINKKIFTEKEALKLPIKGKEFEKYLMPTLYEQSDDPEIIAVSKKIIGGEKNSLIAAEKIVFWVNQHITTKDYATGFNTGKETLKQKKGDCTEHSVLASSLLKAAGIPVKVAAGIAVSGNRFLYHMWIEVYAGKWIPMDPTFNQVAADAARIKMGDGILDEKGKFELLVDIADYLNEIRIEVKRLKTKGVLWTKDGEE